MAQIKSSISDDLELETDIQALIDLTPLVVDVETLDFEKLEFDIPMEAARRTLYSIVTETIFLAPLYQFTTEKTIKAYSTFHPFMVVGNPHSLDFPRSLGFSSFAPGINEEYDLEQNNRSRIERVLREVERIHCMKS